MSGVQIFPPQPIDCEGASECEFAINWEGANIKSIERIIRNGQEETSFGADLGNGKLQDYWFFHCSRKRHTELVAEFRRYLAHKRKYMTETPKEEKLTLSGVQLRGN